MRPVGNICAQLVTSSTLKSSTGQPGKKYKTVWTRSSEYTNPVPYLVPNSVPNSKHGTLRFTRSLGRRHYTCLFSSVNDKCTIALHICSCVVVVMITFSGISRKRQFTQKASLFFQAKIQIKLLFIFQEEEILKCVVGLGVCDGILQRKEMSVDGQPFHPVHKDKLQRLLTLATAPEVSAEQNTDS